MKNIRKECSRETLKVADWYLRGPRYRLETLLGRAWNRAVNQFHSEDGNAYMEEMQADVDAGLRQDVDEGIAARMAVLTCKNLQTVLDRDYFPCGGNPTTGKTKGICFHDVARVILAAEVKRQIS